LTRRPNISGRSISQIQGKDGRSAQSAGGAKSAANGAARGARPGAARAAVAAPERPAIERFFDYTFKDPALLTLALTHSSLAYESNPEGTPDPGSDNEQLEFIGDAVLGLVVAEALYRRFPALREGELTRLRSSLVSSRNLAQVAQRIQLGPMLRLGRGEAHSGGQKKPALLANALEAVIAAMYLDGGLAPAREFIDRHIVEPAEASIASVLHSTEPFSGAVGDYKSALQERLQASGAGQPKYVLTDQTGPDHQRRFRIEVRVGDGDGGALTLASAEGSTKKSAQQEAARLAMASLLNGALLDVLPGPGVGVAEIAAAAGAAGGTGGAEVAP
jgi:ribonuclease-3